MLLLEYSGNKDVVPKILWNNFDKSLLYIGIKFHICHKIFFFFGSPFHQLNEVTRIYPSLSILLFLTPSEFIIISTYSYVSDKRENEKEKKRFELLSYY